MMKTSELEQRAKAFAEKSHEGQRYGDQPYTVHLAAVRETLCMYGSPPNEDLLAAAWLHDVLEDTQVTLEGLELAFGPRVTALVWAVTGVGKNRKERSQSIYDKLAKTPAAVPIKLADRLANVSSCVLSNPKLLEMYRREQPEFRRRLEHLGVGTEQFWYWLDWMLARG